MPSKSKSQQRLMGQAYAYRKGKLKKKDINPKYFKTIKKLADSMKLKDLKDFAKTKSKKLPNKVKKESNILSFKDFIKSINS